MIHILRGSFSAAHFYRQPQWSEEQNNFEFGKCYSQYGHGHDYRIELHAQGDVASLDEALFEVLQQLDHQHLNFTIPFFQSNIPTTENLALYIGKQLLLNFSKQKNPQDLRIVKIKLYETPDLWIELEPSSLNPC